MPKKFTRTIENFVCEHCNTKVRGNGYTNHCPQCLWSKHVDINPGDRAHDCGGLMKPAGIELKQDTTIIIHTCTTCGIIKKNKTSYSDNNDIIIMLCSNTKHLH
ncbi:MAG TPA: RNHCP domain-containing protein [Patescibacteria group bacterium]|nr:RNHCP domain-containing protein [Patescibacteria group bacterium]